MRLKNLVKSLGRSTYTSPYTSMWVFPGLGEIWYAYGEVYKYPREFDTTRIIGHDIPKHIPEREYQSYFKQNLFRWDKENFVKGSLAWLTNWAWKCRASGYFHFPEGTKDYENPLYGRKKGGTSYHFIDGRLNAIDTQKI